MNYEQNFRKISKKGLTFGKNTIEYGQTAYKPYQEWWRERPDETRQPVEELLSKSVARSGEQIFSVTSKNSVGILGVFQAYFCDVTGERCRHSTRRFCLVIPPAWCQIRRQTRDEDSIERTSNLGVRFFVLYRC